jgi:hypothetical protein
MVLGHDEDKKKRKVAVGTVKKSMAELVLSRKNFAFSASCRLSPAH